MENPFTTFYIRQKYFQKDQRFNEANMRATPDTPGTCTCLAFVSLFVYAHYQLLWWLKNIYFLFSSLAVKYFKHYKVNAFAITPHTLTYLPSNYKFSEIL